MEYRRTTLHQNAVALSRLPQGENEHFDEEERSGDADVVCAINTLTSHMQALDSAALQKKSAKDPVLAKVLCFTREGWPHKTDDVKLEKFRKLAESLTSLHGCLLYGTRVVIPLSLQPQVLKIMREGHFGIQRMKQLARTAVYWPSVDEDISNLCKSCISCAEHQNRSPKSPIHPWMATEKPWSRLHLNHAVNFMGCNWLVLVDAYSKYLCITQHNQSLQKLQLICWSKISPTSMRLQGDPSFI